LIKSLCYYCCEPDSVDWIGAILASGLAIAVGDVDGTGIGAKEKVMFGICESSRNIFDSITSIASLSKLGVNGAETSFGTLGVGSFDLENIKCYPLRCKN
jgi:hypothetical protein